MKLATISSLFILIAAMSLTTHTHTASIPPTPATPISS